MIAKILFFQDDINRIELQDLVIKRRKIFKRNHIIIFKNACLFIASFILFAFQKFLGFSSLTSFYLFGKI